LSLKSAFVIVSHYKPYQYDCMSNECFILVELMVEAWSYVTLCDGYIFVSVIMNLTDFLMHEHQTMISCKVCEL